MKPSFLWLHLATLCLTLHGSLYSQTPSPTSTSNKDPKLATAPKMKPYVLIFRQGARPLNDEERKEISAQMPAWATKQSDAGRKFEPRILAPTPGEMVTHGTTTAPTVERPVTALLFIEAENLEDAVKTARTHPGLPYGVSIEVREWSSPAAAAR